MSTAPDSDELMRFREAWKAELKQRTQIQPHQPSEHISSQPTRNFEPATRTAELSSTNLTVSHTLSQYPGTLSHTTKSLSSAIEIYRHGVKHEQHGQLDEALRLYQQAFRMDSNIDKAYNKDELRLASIASAGATVGIRDRQETISSSAAEITKGVQAINLPLTFNSNGTVASTLAKIVSGFPSDLTFEPEDERDGVPLRKLPEELLIFILGRLDSTTIERFATINKKARILTLDATIWRKLVQTTYIPPQVPDDKSIDAIAEQYMTDWRRVYVEHPRLRLDGVYIAVCHYVRPGLSENAWVNISHLITYHRYLRFLSNGQVISLLANEEFEPHNIVPLLKPTLRMKGLFIGDWALQGTTVCITNLADPSGNVGRYTFQMMLSLRSRPTGRWNKLDFMGYESVDCQSGEASPLALKHERPFWFSKVRSY